MIKITRHLYIHPLTVFLFAACYIIRCLDFMFLCYAIIVIHELAHLCAALFIGLIPSKIVIYPFGVNLKLKNKIIYTLSDEIILYAAGPFANIVIAAALLPYIKNNFIYNIYIQNIAFFVLNMLPVLPLDGGIIAKKILTRLLGSKKALLIIKIVSLIITVILAMFGIYLASVKSFSVCLIVIFLICNIFTSEEKYNVDFVKELIFYKEKNKRLKKVKSVIMESTPKKTAELFSPDAYYIVYDINSEGKIENILTETEVMEQLIDFK